MLLPAHQALTPPAIPTAPPGTQQQSNGLLQTRSVPPTPTAHLMKPRKRFLKKFFWFLIHIYKDDLCPVAQRFWSRSRSASVYRLTWDSGEHHSPGLPWMACRGVQPGEALDAGRVHAPVWREPKLPGLGWQVRCSQPSLPVVPDVSGELDGRRLLSVSRTLQPGRLTRVREAQTIWTGKNCEALQIPTSSSVPSPPPQCRPLDLLVCLQ